MVPSGEGVGKELKTMYKGDKRDLICDVLFLALNDEANVMQCSQQLILGLGFAMVVLIVFCS